MIGTDVEVAVHLEDGINSGASGRRTMTHEEMRGVIISALHRGADAVYFFNLFTGPYHRWPRQDHDRLLTDAGSFAALRAASRRHAITITNPWSTGELVPSSWLPYTGKQQDFRLHIGPQPGPNQQARVELVVPDNVEVEVRLNGIPCPGSILVEPEHVKTSGLKEPPLGLRQSFRIPTGTLGEGYNLITVMAKEAVTIKWVEISIQ